MIDDLHQNFVSEQGSETFENSIILSFLSVKKGVGESGVIKNNELFE